MGRISVTLLVIASLCSITINVVYFGESQSVNCLDSEVEALIDFRKRLNDPEGRLSSWRSTNCCQWHGIGCDNSTGAVISIDLHNPYPKSEDSTTRYGFWNLSGKISPSLLKLGSLAYLDLSFNTFEDIPIPEFVGSLSNLQYLNLSKAGFSGTIPPELGNLSSLQYLDVSSVFSSLTVDDFQWVVGLKSLKHLAMNQVDLSLVGSSWLEVLQRLPFLTELHLSVCSLSGSLSSLSLVNFTSLAVIDLSFNTFYSTFPNWLANISSIVYADLSNCGLHGRIPLGLSELPSLKYLYLSGNNNLSASCHEFFGGSWKNIEVLDFSSNKLHGKLPDSVGNLTFLTDFDLSSNNVNGGIPNSIGGLCNLVNFDLSGNNLTGNLPAILEGTESCVSKRPLPRLVNLRLSNNRLLGKLPDWLGRIPNLVELGLEYNLLEGPIPASLGGLKNLTDLGLGGNNLNGTLPETLGQLSELIIFDVSFNRLTGIVTEAHFTKLTKLRFLRLSSNSLILDVSSDWIPPFQVGNFDLGSCNLGPSFPAWLQHQRMANFIDFSNATLSGSIPEWFWDMTFNLSLLNVSHNRIEGRIPSPLYVTPFADIDFSSNLFEGPIPLPSVEIELLDLSNNKFSGPIPQNISQSMPNLIFLSLSNNKLTGEIPELIGEMLLLQVIDLSRNYLTGSIPSSIGNCSYLKVLDLGYNNLSGILPSSLGQLLQLQSLHLNNNNISGEFPLSFKNLSSLQTLDLGENRLSGNIPSWLGDGFTNLGIIKLRSNAIYGVLPAELSNLSSLQVLDLAENNLTGKIPASFGNLKAMTQEKNINRYLLYGTYRGRYYEENLLLNVKGLFQKYTKTLSLVTSLDLSGNNLSGDFPPEITNLYGLVVLNFSRNQISGQIPDSISDMRQLSSLDLSNNKLLGVIPPSMSSLTFLGYLNLSNNNFSGRIPYTGQMTTFSDSAFAENPGLCGAPLVVKCISDDEDSNQENTDEHDESDDFIDRWFYLSIGLGFAFGILAPFWILTIRKPWSEAYFSFVDKVVNLLPWSGEK